MKKSKITDNNNKEAFQSDEPYKEFYMNDQVGNTNGLRWGILVTLDTGLRIVQQSA